MRRRLALLSLLYFVEGLPFGFQVSALPAYLREYGLSLTVIGFAGALSLPWMLKPLWAPLVDRFGSRKSWIVPLQGALALSALVAAYLPLDRGVLPLFGVVFLMNVFAATQDIAIDALAIDLLEPAQLGKANVIQVVGYKAGMLTGGGLLVYASRSIGWHGLFVSMAALIAMVMIVTAMTVEPERARSGRETILAILMRARRSIVGTNALWLVAFVATYKLGEGIVETMFKPFLVDAGYGPETVGLWVGTYGMIASTLGSIAGGVLATRAPLLTGLLFASLARLPPMLLQTALGFGMPISETVAILALVTEVFAAGAVTVVMFAFMMHAVDRKIGATHYAVFAAIEVIGKSPASWASGWIAEQVGYGPTFALGTALTASFALLFGPVRRALNP